MVPDGTPLPSLRFGAVTEDALGGITIQPQGTGTLAPTEQQSNPLAPASVAGSVSSLEWQWSSGQLGEFGETTRSEDHGNRDID